MVKNKPKIPRGRPRAYDPEIALRKATEVFWNLGFNGASLEDLSAAMGMNRPSMYAAFGNKEALFRKALQRYADGPAAYVRQGLVAPTARAVAERLVYGAVDMLSDPHTPPGCLMVQGALSCGESARPIRRELTSRRVAGEAALSRRFKRAISEGDLTADTNPADLARYLATVIHGLAVQAASGANRKELLQVAQIALRALPV